MAYTMPSIPDDKLSFFREQLFRTVSSLFKWEGLPEEIPLDYLERSLVRHGQVMFYNEPDTYGYMVSVCGVRHNNLYNEPVIAYAIRPNTEGLPVATGDRTIAHQYTPELNPDNMCVLIRNMEGGQPLTHIIDFYAYRLALLWQAFDTNVIWQNAPVIFRVGDRNLKLSIEKLFSNIIEGRPFVVVDKEILGNDGKVAIDNIEAEFKLDSLMDSIHEVRNEFYSTVGINTAGADKKERLITDEVNSNKQATQTTLDIMLSYRKKACKEIASLYGISPTVTVYTPEEPEYIDDNFDDSDDDVADADGSEEGDDNG